MCDKMKQLILTLFLQNLSSTNFPLLAKHDILLAGEAYMKFYKDLYVGDTIKNIKKVKRKLWRNAGQVGIYVIALCEGQDQLEIYNSAYLQQKYYKKYPPYIIGIANGYDEAVGIVCKIAKEAYEVNQNCDLKKYLLDRK